MAHVCTNTLRIYGEREKIVAFYKKIEAQDDLEIFKYFIITDGYDLYELECYHDSIYVEFGSKDKFPFESFQNLVKEYPFFEFTGHFEESNNKYFGEVQGIEGVVTSTNLKGLDFYSKYDEEFDTLHFSVLNTPHEKLHEFAMDDKSGWDSDWRYIEYLEPILINRIKQEDLPLFLDCFSEEGKLLLQKRLKGESHD